MVASLRVTRNAAILGQPDTFDKKYFEFVY